MLVHPALHPGQPHNRGGRLHHRPLGRTPGPARARPTVSTLAAASRNRSIGGRIPNAWCGRSVL